MDMDAEYCRFCGMLADRLLGDCTYCEILKEIKTLKERNAELEAENKTLKRCVLDIATFENNDHLDVIGVELQELARETIQGLINEEN